MRFRTVLVGALVVIAVAVGGMVASSWTDISALVSGVRASSELCSTFDEDERLDLMGVETPTRMLDVEGSLDPYTCRWSTSDPSQGSFVQVVSAPAEQWAASVATALASQPPAGDPRRVRQLRRAAAQPIATGADGCRFARRLFRLGGAPDGAPRLVAESLSTTGEPMMMAQSCVDGRYAAVMVAKPAVAVDQALARRTDRALRRLEESPRD
ncbi:hypothetical protein SFC79_17675 [Nocardioides sp. S-58]|uniref:DUF3558 domain-containing protein n=1 Tax=Nocardioides renjunii TaxID=3095075 RepID=A0ABU5KGM5_9ACTN|nr:hypothetical protein [Nocardioides sp. S-58]MDZ5663609.1 hypothetical protein [Nocardioides sp. S-58]